MLKPKKPRRLNSDRKAGFSVVNVPGEQEGTRMRKTGTAGIIMMVALCLFLGTIATNLYSREVPVLKGRVNDYAGMLSLSMVSSLEAKLAGLERTDSTQIAVLTVPSLEGDSLDDFSIRVAEQWKIGQKKLDNGALLIIARDERKARIEVGYGLEGSLTDLVSGRIIDDIIRPHFRAGNYDEGVNAAVDAMISVVRGEFKADGIPGNGMNRVKGADRYAYPLLFLLLFIGIIGSIKRIVGGVVGSVLFPIAGLFFLPFGLWLLFLIPLGFIAGLILPSLFMLFGMTGGRHYGGWGGGGGFSSGGFGGGFSGGGGGFGGGGASGGW